MVLTKRLALLPAPPRGCLAAKSVLFFIHMKTPLLLLAVLTAAAVADDEIIPTSWGEDQFQEMAEKSPFALASAPVVTPPPTAPTVGPFDNMYVAGIGTDYVLVRKVGDDQPMRFWGNEADKEGISVKEILWSEKAAATKVVLKKGNYEKEISFNENTFQAQAAPARGMGGANPRGAAVMNALGNRQAINPVPAPAFNVNTGMTPRPAATTTVPRPALQPTVPRPSGTLTQPNYNTTGNRNNGGGNTDNRTRESLQGRGGNSGGNPRGGGGGNDANSNRSRDRGVRGISQ